MDFKDFKIDSQRSARDICKITGPDSDYPSHVVQGCQTFSRLPLGSLDAEQLRLLLGQNYALKAVVPAAIIMLYHDPFAHGDFYQGDLLKNLLTIEASFWKSNPDLLQKALLVFDRVKSAVSELEQKLAAKTQELEANPDLQDEYLEFCEEISFVDDLKDIIVELEKTTGAF